MRTPPKKTAPTSSLVSGESGFGILYAMLIAGIVATFSYGVFEYWLNSGRQLHRIVDRTKYVDLAPGRAQYFADPNVAIDALTIQKNDSSP